VHIPHIGPATNKVYFDAAIEAFDQAPASQPVFLYLAPSMPHDPRTAEPRFHDLYNPQTIRLPADFRATVPVDFGVLQIRDEQLAAYPRNPDEMRRHLADYYACITSLDYHLGRLLEALKSRGQLEQTLIIFTSDQGLAVGGRHGLMGKQNLYESFKSPLIIAGPGIPTGESQALVYLHDLYPTICELTGVPIPSTCQGQSLGPILRGTQPRVREHLFAVYMDTQRMVRDERFKLLWYPKLTRFELFDLATDPDEQIDLAAQPAHQAVLTRLKTAMRDQQLAQGDRIPVLGTP
jgi:arylsulfatase A-like enzyme